MDAYISHTYMYICICVHSYIQTHVFVHIHTAHSHICTCIYTVIYPLTGRNTHAHMYWNSRDIQPFLWLLFCAQSQESIVSPSDITSLHLLFPLASLPIFHLEVVPIINRICPRGSPHLPYIHNLFNSKRENEEKISRPEFSLPVPLGMVHCSQTPKQLLE